MASQDFNPSADSWLDTFNPNTNYGSDDKIYLNSYSGSGAEKSNGLLKFNVSSIAPCLVTSATLKLYARSWGGIPLSGKVYRVKKARDWIEAQVTWNNWKTGNAWQVAGAKGADDIYTTAIASPTWIFNWNNVNIGTATVQAWIDDPAENQGLKIASIDTSGSGITFNSKEYASNKPILTVEYTPTLDGGKLTTKSKYW